MTPIFFDHIPKAGGMSLVKVFEDIAGKSAVQHVNGLPASAVCNHSVDIPVVSGHFIFTQGESLPAGRFCLTMLREPLDRVLSSYYFARHDASVALSANAAFAQSLSLEEYIESEVCAVRSDVSNAQTNHFYPLGWNGGEEPEGDQKLLGAKLALEQFDLVGIFEDYQGFIDLLCYEQGWPPAIEIPRENVTVWRQKMADLPSHLIARMRVLNELDTELYEHARKLFHKHRRRIMLTCMAQRNAGCGGAESTGTNTPKSGSISSVESSPLSSNTVDFGDHGAEIVSIDVRGDLVATPQIFSGELFVCQVTFKANEDIPDLTVGIHIHDRNGLLTFGTNSRLHGMRLSVTKGAVYYVEFAARCDLGIGTYSAGAALHVGSSHLQRCFHWREKVVNFEITGHLGYHAEGSVKLHPTIQCGALDSTSGLLIRETVNIEEAGLRFLGRDTPPLPEFSAVIHALNIKPISVTTGQIFEIEVEVTNSSQCTWPAIGSRPVYISYHWLDSTGNMLVFDGKRTPLPRDVPPAMTFRSWATIRAPDQTGDARLQLILVQEQVAWFDEAGCPSAVVLVAVCNLR